MGTLTEVETAIEQLPTPQVEELAVWLELLRARRAAAMAASTWLERARGALAG